MRPKKDLTGLRFGRLVVISVCPERRNGQEMWLCKCDCGNDHIVSRMALNPRGTKSCGCSNREHLSKLKRTHGKTNTPEFESWSQMTKRCTCPTNKDYPSYGGRGIGIYPDWTGEHGFENFLSYMGNKPTPQHSLDRWPNNDTGHYQPGNVRWATKKEQIENRRNSRWEEYDGKRMLVGQWAQYLNISYETLQRFLRKGTIADAVFRYKTNYNSNEINNTSGRSRRYFGGSIAKQLKKTNI
jgi:hypothetical protein